MSYICYEVETEWKERIKTVVVGNEKNEKKSMLSFYDQWKKCFGGFFKFPSSIIV